MFSCHLPPALFAEWRGSFMCRCSNTGVERTPNKSTQSWLWRRKSSRRFCRDLNSQSVDHESGALTNKLSRLPHSLWCREMHIACAHCCRTGTVHGVLNPRAASWSVTSTPCTSCILTTREKPLLSNTNLSLTSIIIMTIYDGTNLDKKKIEKP